VQVLLDGESLQFVPAPEEYHKEMDVMVHGFVSTLCTVTRLLAQDELMTQVLEPGMDIEMGSSLAELIECDIHTELTAEIKFFMAVAFDAAEERKQLYKPFQGLCAVNHTRDAETLKAEYLAKERTLQVSEWSIYEHELCSVGSAFPVTQHIAECFTLACTSMIPSQAASALPSLAPSARVCTIHTISQVPARNHSLFSSLGFETPVAPRKTCN